MPALSRLLAVGAVATAASFAASGPASAADANPTVTQDGSTYTMKLHGKTTSEQFVPKGGTPTNEEPKDPPKPGDAFQFSEDQTQGGTKVGSSTGKCTLTSATSATCTVTVTFPNGTFAVTGSPEFTEGEDESAPETFQVVGGTGAYAGAKGKAVVRDLNETDSDIVVTYTLDGSQVTATPSGGADTGFGSTAATENVWLFGLGGAAAAAGLTVLGVSTRRTRRSS